tara:strand:- start:2551 stop:3537 length:987 start_codon:yes stop_codon:yes gene_type:complete
MLILKLTRKIVKYILCPFIRDELFDYSNDRTLIEISSKVMSAEDSNNHIYQLLNNPQPCMVGRLGNTEINTLIKYDNFIKMNIMEKVYQWSLTSKYPFSSNCVLVDIFSQSGFYPVNRSSLAGFKKELVKAMKDVDILGSWIKGENRFIKYMPEVTSCELKFLEPYYHKNPWTRALEGKNVLVIHPFALSMENQYKQNRKNLFKDKHLLPLFNVRFLKSPFTTPGEKHLQSDWFNTLDSLYNEAVSTDFDIAILGCGAYGFPLASKLKKYGKKAIHLGGATQLLFGVKGKRWSKDNFFQKLFNDFWVYPSQEEIPIDHQGMDQGCYWK